MPHKFDFNTVPTPARKYGSLTPGKAVKMLRELREMTQARLSKLTGIPQPAISAIEHDKENVGIERSKKLARVLKVHPATIAFADW